MSHEWMHYKPKDLNFKMSEFEEKVLESKNKLLREGQDETGTEALSQDSDINDADLSETQTESSDESFVGQKRIDFKYIDRSFTNLGYIGYNEGIQLN